MSIPDAMTAIEIAEPGGPEMLRPTRRPTPRPAEGEILVRVAAAGVNFPDVMQRRGSYPPPSGITDIPGLELAGTVIVADSGVNQFAPGDEVCALVAGGAYAEYCTVPAPQALPLPNGFDMVRSAALPENFFTVWTNVFQRSRLRAGETFLVHGGASGIGTTAIQLARERGARVFATAGSGERCRACEALGAERGIDYRREDFAAVVAELTDGRGVDVILDMAGGAAIARNIRALAVEGRLCFIAFLAGSRAEIDFLPVMLKRATITGSTLRARPVAEKGAIAAELRREVLPLLESGRVKPAIHASFPLAEAGRAQQALDGHHIGKIVLEVAP